MSHSLITHTARIVSIFIFAGLISCNTHVEQEDFADWLVDGQQRKAEITLLDGKEIQMDNGLHLNAG